MDIYTLFILIFCPFLVARFVIFTEVSGVGKGVVFGLYIFSLASYSGWIPVNGLVGTLLMVGLSIFIIFYLKWHKLY